MSETRTCDRCKEQYFASDPLAPREREVDVNGDGSELVIVMLCACCAGEVL